MGPRNGMLNLGFVLACACCAIGVTGNSIYGFGSAVSPSTGLPFVRMSIETGNMTALWTTPLNLEPYVAALDQPRGVIYGVTSNHFGNISLVALSLENGATLWNVSLPFGLYPSSGAATSVHHPGRPNNNVGHSAGTRTGTMMDLEPTSGDLLIGGFIVNKSQFQWRDSDKCSPGCNASVCCIDPENPDFPACFAVPSCASISDPGGTSKFVQYRLDAKTHRLTEFDPLPTPWAKAGSSVLDANSGTLYVQLSNQSSVQTGVVQQGVFAYAIKTGKLTHTINSTAAMVAAGTTDFGDMVFDQKKNMLLAVSLCVKQKPVTAFARCLMKLDPVTGKIEQAGMDAGHNDRVGVDSVLDPATRTVWLALPVHPPPGSATGVLQMVGYNADTGAVNRVLNLTQPHWDVLFPNDFEIGS